MMANGTAGMTNPMGTVTAKLSRQEERWLPLWIHSLDTCGVIQKLFEQWLPEHTRQAMQEGITREELLQAVRAAAVMHDIGKVTAGFQSRISSGCSLLRERLAQAGLFCLDEKDTAFLKSKGQLLSHAAAGEALLLRAGCPREFAEVMILFPACAGVILLSAFTCGATTTFPRMRGGDPIALNISNHLLNFSPHARG